MRLDLHRRATGGLDERLHGVNVLLNAVRLRLPVDIHENVVGVIVGEDATPVRSVPAREIELIHTVEIARYLVVGHAVGLLPDHSSTEILRPEPARALPHAWPE